VARALAIAVAAALVVPSTASAAAPLAVGQTEYQLWIEGRPGGAIAIVSVTLPAETPLPATVRIPVPSGMTVDWAGEIAGDDPANDIERPYTIKQGDGGSYAEFEVSSTREAQIDAAGTTLQGTGPDFSAQFELVQSVSTSGTGVSVRMPAGVSNVRISPVPDAAPQANETGEALYALKTPSLSEGERLAVSVSYSKGAAPAAGGSGGSGQPDGLISFLVVLLGAAVVLLVVVAGRSRRAQQ
jgi:hypothetical protein